MNVSEQWFTVFIENEQNQMVTILGRDGLDKFRLSGKFSERVEIFWKYEPSESGYPSETTALQMEEMENLLKSIVEKENLAVNTAIYTDNGERSWVFYTKSAEKFGVKLNEILKNLQTLPITITAEIDADWEEYLDMYEMKRWASDQD